MTCGHDDSTINIVLGLLLLLSKVSMCQSCTVSQTNVISVKEREAFLPVVSI